MILSDNPRARFDYHILDTFEAGIVLTGAEVKSAKQGSVSLKGSFVTVQNSELWLLNAHIAPYGPAAGHQRGYDPRRTRKLLLRGKQIASLIGKSKEDGLTIIPLKVYTKNRLVKVEIATAKGKKQFDKRASIKKREVDRNIRRALKR